MMTDVKDNWDKFEILTKLLGAAIVRGGMMILGQGWQMTHINGSFPIPFRNLDFR